MQAFDYDMFLSRSTNYFLPWLALTAQLPYASGDPIPDIMSFFTALGSPMLLTFSLMMTILNQRWLHRRFRQFKSQFPQSRLLDRVRSASKLLEAAQQVPLRLRHGDGWLASLILLDDDEKWEKWWADLKRNLRSTRRKLTVSLVAQMLAAIAAWILTVIGWLGSAMGNADEGLSVSSSMLWTWLVPVILGWITVGTQNSPRDIRENLSDPPQPSFAGWNRHDARRKKPFYTAQAEDDLSTLGLLGFSIHGDELHPGPTYNYARIYTWRYTAARLLAYFEAAAAHLAAENAARETQGRQATTTPDASSLARACGLPRPSESELTTYPSFNHHRRRRQGSAQEGIDSQGIDSQGIDSRGIDNRGNDSRGNDSRGIDSRGIDGEFYRQVLGAAATAAAVQWATAGSAIVISYLTDVRGLGCRSGGYLLYGVLSTAAFLSLMGSVHCSRQAILRHREEATTGHGGLSFQFWRALALVLRLVGKILVVGNAVWLMLSSLAELIGLFDSCWCHGVVFQWGDRAWVALFKSPSDLEERASGPWAGGVAMASCTMLFSYLWFALLCRRSG
ncbi:hypothetical protein VTJ49DRAFT_1009 [Mycothermus thermophilus]|uniref:Uncharacterized protein n=1 Tax=Humicola insolens TaxID=85995 RepID=A0ABR3VES9_HUMIN